MAILEFTIRICNFQSLLEVFVISLRSYASQVPDQFKYIYKVLCSIASNFKELELLKGIERTVVDKHRILVLSEFFVFCT